MYHTEAQKPGAAGRLRKDDRNKLERCWAVMVICICIQNIYICMYIYHVILDYIYIMYKYVCVCLLMWCIKCVFGVFDVCTYVNIRSTSFYLASVARVQQWCDEVITVGAVGVACHWLYESMTPMTLDPPEQRTQQRCGTGLRLFKLVLGIHR